MPARTRDSGNLAGRVLTRDAARTRAAGDLAACIALLQEVAGTTPEHLPARLDLAESLGLAGRIPEAQAIIDQLPDDPGIAEERRRIQEALRPNQ